MFGGLFIANKDDKFHKFSLIPKNAFGSLEIEPKPNLSAKNMFIDSK